jgi:ketosteroid isomerase-like protein
MSQDNVDRLRAFCTRWGMDQEPDFSLLDPDVVFEDDILPDHAGEAYRGHEGMMRAIRTWLQPYERFTIELEDVVGSGDRLVSIHRFRATAQHTGIEAELHYAYLWTFRDGKVVHVQSFRDPEEAELRALAATVYDALNTRDLDAFLALLTDDVEFTSLIAEAEGASFRGRDGVLAWWETVLASFGDVHWDVLELIPGPDGKGVIHIRITGTIAGVPVEQTMWQATRTRDGKVNWWALFRTKREAFEAAGLPAPPERSH